MGVSRAVHRMPRRRRRRKRRGVGAGRRVRTRAQAAAQASGLHRGRVQAPFHPERLLPHRCGSVQVDLARPRGRSRHAGVQVPSRAGPLGGGRLHQDTLAALGGGGGLAGGTHHDCRAAAARSGHAARGQGRLRAHAVRRVPRPPRQGRRTVGAGSRGRQRPADRAPGLHRRRAVRGRQQAQGRLPDVHHRPGRHADAFVRGLPRRRSAVAARVVRDVAPARLGPVCGAGRPAEGARRGYRVGRLDSGCRPGFDGGAGAGRRSRSGDGRRRGDAADRLRPGFRGRHGIRVGEGGGAGRAGETEVPGQVPGSRRHRRRLDPGEGHVQRFDQEEDRPSHQGQAGVRQGPQGAAHPRGRRGGGEGQRRVPEGASERASRGPR